jgi:hypothetical protein
MRTSLKLPHAPLPSIARLVRLLLRAGMELRHAALCAG